MSLDTIIFPSAFGELIAAADVALPARSKLLTTLIAQIVRFARPNIQIYDAHVVDLYEWVCARYLLGVKVQIQKQSAIWALHSTELQNGSRWLLPKVRSGEQLSKGEIHHTFQYDMTEIVSVNPH